MRRKKREPLGKSMRWERGSSRSVSTRSPSLYHSMVGGGRPSALQLRVAGSPLDTIKSEGSSTILGTLSSNRVRDPVKIKTDVSCASEHEKRNKQHKRQQNRDALCVRESRKMSK